MKHNRFVFAALTFTLFFGTASLSRAGGLNIPPDSDGGKICKVTNLVDDATVQGSIRRALDQGYNVNQSGLPSFCTEKIVFDVAGIIHLNAPIVLNNSAATGFILEKGSASGDLTLDASGLPGGSCAVEINSQQVTVRGIKIVNASGAGICIDGGANRNVIERVTVTGSGQGVWVKSGSQGNMIREGAFHDNTGFGVKLETATQNTVTVNALYGNGSGAVDSPAAEIKPEITNAVANNTSATSFSISGHVPTAVEHIELFRGALSGGTTNYITNVVPDPSLDFFVSIDAQNGEQVFAIGIGSDGSTSPSSPFARLSTTGGGGPGNPNGPRSCFPGQEFPPYYDYDGDGIPDVLEDKNKNCIVDADETDPANADTDGDEIPDGKEDRNHNGKWEPELGESDPRLFDTDGDGLSDGVEDRNHNGLKEFGELSPLKTDTDDDGIPDNIEDADHNGIWTTDETDGTRADTDLDGIPDGQEDKNHNGVKDKFETDPRKTDTDGDGIPDGDDPCPLEDSLLCQHACVFGEVPDESLDSDADGIPDKFEDFNHDCVKDGNETDPYMFDTDGDGKGDGNDPCPLNPDKDCVSTCIAGAFVPPNRDSDSDGLKDVEEDKNGNCVVEPGESDPFNSDTDHDGIPDKLDACPQDDNTQCTHPCIPGTPPPADLDSDGDGIPDLYEDIDHNCAKNGNETDFRARDTDGDGLQDNFDPCPLNPDTACKAICVAGAPIVPGRDIDQDGLPDMMEDKNNNCILDFGETSPTDPDTDHDGLPDGIEDRNHNGVVDGDETDPRKPDTDGDGILDGLEDRNHNGLVDFGELNPLSQDTDQDGIPDRLEDVNLNGVVDPGETNGALPDTDNDGVPDGVEDANHNGQFDPGETDPRNSDTDGDGAPDGVEMNQGTSPIRPSQHDLNQAMGKGGCALSESGVGTTGGWIPFGGMGLILWGLRSRRRRSA